MTKEVIKFCLPYRQLAERCIARLSTLQAELSTINHEFGFFQMIVNKQKLRNFVIYARTSAFVFIDADNIIWVRICTSLTHFSHCRTYSLRCCQALLFEIQGRKSNSLNAKCDFRLKTQNLKNNMQQAVINLVEFIVKIFCFLNIQIFLDLCNF